MGEPAVTLDSRSAVAHAEALFSREAWDELCSLEQSLPSPLTDEALPLADKIAFAMTQRKRFARAFALVSEAYALDQTHRRASAAAYSCYASLMEEKLCRGTPPATLLPRQSAREAFRIWIARALVFCPGSVKDLYRLGVFEAQLEAAHDKRALRAFLGAIESFDALPPTQQKQRGDLRKACHRALYAAARSALRLDMAQRARALVFACIRRDRDTDDVDPLFKMGLAGRVCLATKELDAAERALRIALDAKGPPRRDYLFGLLADVAAARGDFDAAIAWTDRVCPPRRAPIMWRRIGEYRLAQGGLDAALAAFNSALLRDKAGRHLTLVCVGQLHEKRCDWKAAERAYRDADDFRRRKYLSPDAEAAAGLARVMEAREARGPSVRKTSAAPPAPEGHAGYVDRPSAGAPIREVS